MGYIQKTYWETSTNIERTPFWHHWRGVSAEDNLTAIMEVLTKKLFVNPWQQCRVFTLLHSAMIEVSMGGYDDPTFGAIHFWGPLDCKIPWETNH